MANTENKLFDTVDFLSANRPFTPDILEKLFSIKMAHIESESNEYFSKYRSLESIIKRDYEISIELRFPKPKSGHSDGLLILRVKSGSCITQKDVLQHFGLGEPIPPNPDMPAEEAQLSIAYTYDWGKIIFGLNVNEPQCLNSIVLDAIN